MEHTSKLIISQPLIFYMTFYKFQNESFFIRNDVYYIDACVCR